MNQNQKKQDVFAIEETGEATKEEINQYMDKQLDSLLEENIKQIGKVSIANFSNELKKQVWEEYKKRVDGGEKPADVMDGLGIKRYCCRTIFLTHVDLIKEVARFKI